MHESPGMNKFCSHCKDELIPSKTIKNERGDLFCCQGCLGVYQLVHELGIEEFYQLDAKAGLSLRNHQSRDYQFLESEEMLSRLSHKKKSEHIFEYRLFLPSIHCAACVLLLENLPRMMKNGILEAKVHYPRKELILNIDVREISLHEILPFLDSMGYQVSLETITQQSDTEQSNTLLNLAIAGFCFGNCMLFSFPEYLAIELSSSFERVFRVLSLVLATASTLLVSRHYFVSAYRSIQARVLSLHIPVSIGIFALYFESVRQVVLNIGQGYSDSLTGFLFFLHIGKYLQEQSLQHLSFDKELKSYFPLSALKIEGNTKVPTPVENLQTQDQVYLRMGELISFDGVLLSDQAEIDYSFFTGESEAIQIKKGGFAQAGGRIISSSARFEVQLPISKSKIQKFWESLDQQSESTVIDFQTSAWTNRTASIYTPTVLLAALVNCFYWLGLGNFALALETTVAVLIIACPCAISLSLPFTGASVLSLLRSRGLYLKSIQVLEKVYEIQGIILDKTGTLSESIRELIFVEEKPTDENLLGAIRTLALHSTHPISRTVAHNLSDFPLQEILNVNEIVGLGMKGSYQGKSLFLGKSDKLSESRGKTVIEYDSKLYPLEFREKQRSGLSTFLSNLDKDYPLVLLSGDHGVANPSLEQLINDHFQEAIFELNPQEKAQKVRELEERNGYQLMIGDGLNDAGAMHHATLSLSVVEDQASFHPSCDMILEGQFLEDFTSQWSILNGSRYILLVCLLFAAFYNIIGLSLAVTANLTPLACAILMPLSSLTILAITLVGTWLLSVKYPIRTERQEDLPRFSPQDPAIAGPGIHHSLN